MDNTTCLEIDVSKYLKSEYFRMTVLLDWPDSCGNIIRNKLLETLVNLDFPYSFIGFMKSILTDKSNYFEVNETKGETSVVTKGL